MCTLTCQHKIHQECIKSLPLKATKRVCNICTVASIPHRIKPVGINALRSELYKVSKLVSEQQKIIQQYGEKEKKNKNEKRSLREAVKNSQKSELFAKATNVMTNWQLQRSEDMRKGLETLYSQKSAALKYLEMVAKEIDHKDFPFGDLNKFDDESLNFMLDRTRQFQGILDLQTGMDQINQLNISLSSSGDTTPKDNNQPSTSGYKPKNTPEQEKIIPAITAQENNVQNITDNELSVTAQDDNGQNIKDNELNIIEQEINFLESFESNIDMPSNQDFISSADYQNTNNQQNTDQTDTNSALTTLVPNIISMSIVPQSDWQVFATYTDGHGHAFTIVKPPNDTQDSPLDLTTNTRISPSVSLISGLDTDTQDALMRDADTEENF